MDKKIEDLSVSELKAMVYDHLANIEGSQNSIKFLNEEIRRRKSIEVKPSE